MAPIAPGVQVAEEKTLLQAQLDACHRTRYFSRHEGLAADRAFMVEQNSVAGVHAISLAVIHRDPVGIQLGHRVRAAGIEGRRLLLRRFLHQPEQLGCRSLVKTALFLQAQDAHGLQNAQRPQRVRVGGVFGLLETHRHMRLGGEIVDFVGQHLLDDAGQAGAVRHIAVVQDESPGRLMRVLVQVVDTVGVEKRCAPLHAMNLVALGQQKLGEVGAVLAGHAGNQGLFHAGNSSRAHRIEARKTCLEGV